MKKYETVHDYINSLPRKSGETVKTLRSIFKETVPEGKEIFKSNYLLYDIIPTGKREHQIMIAGYENHVSFYPQKEILNKFRSELHDYNLGKGTVQFSVEKPLPIDLVKRMILEMKANIANNI